jgi:2'-5' RNA ligase
MYYCLSFYPQLSPELTRAIDAIRSVYDPTSPYYTPHITLIFPTHHRVGQQPLISHIEQVLRGWSPFEIRLGGFQRSPNHWLFLNVYEGETEVKRLYRELHTGVLDDGRDVNKFVPHLGLGLFVKEGCIQDWFNPRESDFDKERYEVALRQAETLPLAERIRVEKLVLGTISDAVIDWTRGQRADLPEDAYETAVRDFRLGRQNQLSSR